MGNQYYRKNKKLGFVPSTERGYQALTFKRYTAIARASLVSEHKGGYARLDWDLEKWSLQPWAQREFPPMLLEAIHAASW